MTVAGKLSKIKIERPLANAHWSLLIVLIALYELAWWAFPCSELPPSASYLMIIISFMIALWVRHLKFRPINNYKIFFKYLFNVLLDVFLFIILLILVAVPFAIVTPTYQCYTVRSMVSEGLLAASMQRTTIAETYANTSELPANYVANEKSRYVSSVEWIKYEPNSGVVVVTFSSDEDLKEAANGTMLLKAKGDPTTREVEFICSKGSVPVKYIPSACRN